MAEIKLKTVVTLRVSGNCSSHSRTDIGPEGKGFIIDEPVERGGTDKGPSPTETALAALVGCTNTIGHKCAEKLGVDIGNLQISVSCKFDRRGVTLAEVVDQPFREITLTVVADGPASEEDLQRVSAETALYCPLSRLFRAAGTTINETWRKA